MPDGSTSEIFSAAIVKISGQNMNLLLDEIDPKFRMSKSIEKVPVWIKNNAGWWADGSIDDSSFVQGIQFLIKEKIIEVDTSTLSKRVMKFLHGSKTTQAGGLMAKLLNLIF